MGRPVGRASYPGAMLEARRVSLWSGRYELVADGRPFALWDGRVRGGGGVFDLEGRRYQVRSNLWGSHFELVDQVGMVAAVAERPGRMRWTVQAGGRAYGFQRESWWRSAELLVADGRTVGSVRPVGGLKGGAVADLPGLPLPLQVFVVVVVVTTWNAAAASS